MFKIIRLMALALLAMTYMADISEAVQAGGTKTSYSSHSYDQNGPREEFKAPPAPEIIHNPPLQIPSFQDYNITATINNLGGGIPLIYYRFDGDKKFLKRAFRMNPSGVFEFKILSAALTGDKLDYYIEITTGSEVTATLGDQDSPLSVKIVAPSSNVVFLWVVIGLAAAVIILKLAAIVKNSFNDKKTIEPETPKTAGNKLSKTAKLHLSARGK